MGLALLVSAVHTEAQAVDFSLPLGDRDLIEVRTSETLSPGVQLVRIERGAEPAPAGQIATTTRGPWHINVVSIDPATARGQLSATYGPDLSRVETTTRLAGYAGAVAGVNASYFTFTKNPLYPGDPVGLGLYGGQLLSEPAATSTEVDFVVDAKSKKVLIGRLTWSGAMRNRSTDKTMALEYLNHPPVVPSACRTRKDQTTCAKSGDVVHFTRAFGTTTPAGYGIEVVLSGSGCVVKRLTKRGTALAAGQTSLQATGRQTRALLRLTKKGCLSRRLSLFDENRKPVKMTSSLFGVAGRYRLTRQGRVVVPSVRGAFAARNPRTLVGTTADGKVALVTIDGRQTTSVGTTLAETAAVAQSLGLTDAVNLDGGASATLTAAGQLINYPSAGRERAVGDALVYVP